MAYKEHGMWEVLEVLRRAHRGETLKAIARSTGRSRNTVKRYLAAARKVDWQPGQGEPDEGLAARVWARLRPGPSRAEPSEPARLLQPQREQIERWLRGDTDDGHPLQLTKVHDLLGRRDVEVTYSSLYRFAVEHCGFGDKPSTVRVADVAPGELAEIDFGRLGLIRDGLLERRRVHSSHRANRSTLDSDVRKSGSVSGTRGPWL